METLVLQSERSFKNFLEFNNVLYELDIIITDWNEDLSEIEIQHASGHKTRGTLEQITVEINELIADHNKNVKV